jgi:PAS domain S-box-containing protein
MNASRNAARKRKVMLLHKGLLIVGIPFLCQLFIIGLLLHEVQKSEAEAATEAQAEEIVDQTQRVTEACYGVVFAAWNCRYTSATTTQNLIEALGSLPPARDSLQKTLNARPADSSEYEKFSNTLDKLSGEFSQWRYVIASVKMVDKSKLLVTFDDKAVRQGLASQLERVAHGLNEINRRSDTIRATSPERQMMVQSEMQLIGIIGGMPPLCSVSAWFCFFSKHIKSRVSIISENSQRLVDGNPLDSPLTGNDGISEVDAVFHKMARMLEEARAKEAALINNAHEVICSVDAQGNFVKLKSTYSTQWGYSPQQLTGRSVRTVVDNAYATATPAALDAARTKKPVSSFESGIMRKDGSLLNVAWSVCWSEVEQLLFCVVPDITERKQAERLRQDFFAMVSRDLKAPQ